MLKVSGLTLLLLSSLFLSACDAGTADTTPPTVVSLMPSNALEGADESKQVDAASVTKLQVTFSEPMMDHAWSFAYQDESKFPTLAGDPSYSEDHMTVSLPVSLEPGKDYEIWLNSENYDGFRDEHGNALEPYQWTFSTKE